MTKQKASQSQHVSCTERHAVVVKS